MKVSVRFAIALSCSSGLVIDGEARAQTPTTTRVSVATGGAQGNSGGGVAAISANGRFVAFDSVSSNLVAGDTNAFQDIFLRDRTSGTTERISVATGGAQADADCRYPSISADGRFVAFASSASNLVAGDTNGIADLFLHDRTSGTTERINLATGGTQADYDSYSSSLSADGRCVVFLSSASNLVAGDTNDVLDVFLRDLQLGTTERVSIDSAGVEANCDSSWASISADGRYVAFASCASNLVAADTNGVSDVYVRDRQTGTTERVSVGSSGAEGNFRSYSSSISVDGRYVAFVSQSSNLVAGDTNNQEDTFVRDRASGKTERVSVDSSGVQANSHSLFPSISGDGRFVTFQSYGSNLAVGDTNNAADIFVHDRMSGTTERVSVATNSAQGSSHSWVPSISADGRVVAFYSYATNLVAGDTNGYPDVFVRDQAPEPAVVVYCTSGTSSSGCSASIAAIANPSLSFEHACNITVTSVEGHKSGVLFYCVDNAGFAPRPWLGSSTSWLCVKQPVQRTPIQNSGGTANACNGTFVLDWHAYQAAHPLALGNPWSLGAKLYAQAWFRDPFGPTWTNLSNAVELTYLP